MAITYNELEEFDIINYQLLALNTKTVINKFINGEYQDKLPEVVYSVLDKAKNFIAQIQAGSLKGTPSRYDKRLLPTLESTWISEYAKRTWKSLNEKQRAPLEEKVDYYLSAIEAVEKQESLSKDLKENLKGVARFFKGLYDIFGRDLDEMTLAMKGFY